MFFQIFSRNIFAYNIKIENKKIKAIKKWIKSKVIRNIEIFIGFVGFFIQKSQSDSSITKSNIKKILPK